MRALAAGGLLVVLTVLAYSPALRGGFTWNDRDYVTAPALQSGHGLWRIWFELGATQQYYPVLHTAFWVEHRLWGESAAGYHLANVLLHATASLLFAMVLRRLWRRSATASAGDRAAYLAGLLFALHPVCVESAAWISEQKNTLSTVFYLASALVYFGGSGKRGSYSFATLLYLLAVLSKTVTATLPVAILVAGWWCEGRLTWKKDVRPLLPWFAAGAIAGLFSAWVEWTYIGAQGAAFSLGFLQRCLLAGRIFWFYLGKLVWPANLIFIYPRWVINAAQARAYFYPGAVIALCAVLWRFRRRSRAPLAAFLYFAASLFPVLGFFNVYAFIYSFVADHWQYLASLGVMALAAGAWGRWLEAASSAPANGRGKPVALAGPYTAALAIAFALGCLTWRQSRMYNDIERFYRTTIERNPACWMAYNNLGTLYQNRGRTPEAIADYRQALRIDPGLAEVHYNLGNSLADSGHAAAAMAEYGEALRLKPVFPEAYYCSGLVLAKMGKIPDAISDFEKALRLRANFPQAENSLGTALLAVGQPEKAILHYEKALRLRPDLPETRNDWGNFLLGLGHFQEAVVQFRTALRLRPNYPQAHYNLGVALAKTGRGAEAMAEYEQALALQPDYPEAENNLGAALAVSGRTSEAIAHYQRALQLKPDYPEARYNLELALRAGK